MAETIRIDLADLTTVKFCASCDTAYGEEDSLDDAGPLYECGSCGEQFTRDESEYGSHRCSCGKFASKLFEAGEFCPDCKEELEEADAIEGHDGGYIVIEGVEALITARLWAKPKEAANG